MKVINSTRINLLSLVTPIMLSIILLFVAFILFFDFS